MIIPMRISRRPEPISMRIVIDTNVIIDVLSKRKNFYEDSLKTLKLCETNQVEGFVSALSIANIVYILRKELNSEETKRIITLLSNILTIDDLKGDDLIKASIADGLDFEDELQMVSAKRVKADFIVTRDAKHFANSPIPIISPTELLSIFTQTVLS